MDNIQFYKSFYFFECLFTKYHHTDNSAGTSCHHIGYIKSGKARFCIGDTVFEFSEGDVFYTPPSCKYHSYWEGEEIRYDSYAFNIFPSKSSNEYGVQTLVMTDRAKDVLTELTRDKKVSCRSVGLLYELLDEALPFMVPTVRDLQKETISRARAYMRRNINCSVPELSRYLSMSESAVYSLFREKLSSTPISEKNKIRTEMALELLSTTDMSVEQISEKLGFSSAAYFRKVLKTFCDKTPRELRQKVGI